MTFRESLIRKQEPGVADVHIASAQGFGPALARRKKKRKVAKDVDVTIAIPIKKIEEDKNRVFGWASVTEKNGETVLDLQDDWITESDLEEALYDFAKNARIASDAHDLAGSGAVGTMIECMAFTKEKQKALGIDLGRVGAWIGFELAPAIFAKVKTGEYQMFSIGGSGRRLVDG